MPKCPECGKEIDHLHAYCRELNKYDVTYDGKYDTLNWGSAEPVEGSNKKTEYGCPECEKILFAVDNDDGLPPNVLEFMRQG